MSTAPPDKEVRSREALLQSLVNTIQDALRDLMDSTTTDLAGLRAAQGRDGAARDANKDQVSAGAAGSLPAFLLIRGRNGSAEYINDGSATLRRLCADGEMAVLVPLRSSSAEVQAPSSSVEDGEGQGASKAARGDATRDSEGVVEPTTELSPAPSKEPGVPDQNESLPIRVSGSNHVIDQDEATAADVSGASKDRQQSSTGDATAVAGTGRVDGSASGAEEADSPGARGDSSPLPVDLQLSDAANGTTGHGERCVSDLGAKTADMAGVPGQRSKLDARGDTAAAESVAGNVADNASADVTAPAQSKDNHDHRAPAAENRAADDDVSHTNRAAAADRARDVTPPRSDDGVVVAAVAARSEMASAAGSGPKVVARSAARPALATPPQTPQSKRKAAESAVAGSSQTPSKRMRKMVDKTGGRDDVAGGDGGDNAVAEPSMDDLVKDLTSEEAILQVVGVVAAWRTQHKQLREVVAVGGRVGTEKRTLGILARIEGVGDASGLWQCVGRFAWADLAAHAKERARKSGQERTLTMDVDRLVKQLSQGMVVRTNLRRVVHEKLAEGRRWNDLLGRHIGLLAMIPLSTGRRRETTLAAYRALAGKKADTFRAALEGSAAIKSAKAIGKILHDAFTGEIHDIPELAFEFGGSAPPAKRGKATRIELGGLEVIESPQGLECADRDDWGARPRGWSKAMAWPDADGIPAGTKRCNSCSGASQDCDCKSVRYGHEPILTYAGLAVGRELVDEPEWRAPVSYERGDPIGYVSCMVVPKSTGAAGATMPLVRTDLPQQPVAGHLSFVGKRNRVALFVAYHLAKWGSGGRDGAAGAGNVVLHGTRVSGRFVIELQAISEISAGDVLVLGSVRYTGDRE